MDSPLLGRSIASKLRPQQADKVFGGKAREISEKDLFTFRPATRESRENLEWAIKGEKPVFKGEQTLFRKKLAAGQF